MLKDVLLVNVLRFILLSVLQILYFSNINLYGYFNPQVFLLIILLFPIHISTVYIMLMAFGIGMIQDVFNGTMGLHTFVCVFIGFIRVFIVRLFTEKKLDETFELTFSEQGFRFYFLYLLFSFMIYHFIYYSMEMFSFSNILYISLKTIGSTALALVFSFLFLYIFKGKKVFVKY
jgi:rod shape-determining protein MreD